MAPSGEAAAVEALSGLRVAQLRVAITRAGTAVGEAEVAGQAAAAALPIHLPAAGALPRHLVTQRAQRALRVALARWKTPKAKLCP